MNVNRRGITRTVILTKRYAIKLPSFRGGSRGPRGRVWSICSGILANDQEREWSSWPGVNPVLWSLGSLVNVYARAVPVPDDFVPNYANISPEFVLADRKPENVGLVNGRLVWIDYA